MNSENTVIKQLSASIALLMTYCSSLKDENDRLIKEISQREDVLLKYEEEIENLKTDISNLKFVQSANSNNEYADEAKKKLTKLMRDVDKCISLLRS